MNHFGEIEYLSKLTQPTIAIITNAALCHIEGVGDIAGVAQAKAEIFSGLPAHGIVILNRDDTYFNYWLQRIGQRSYISFGFHPEAHVRTQLLDNSTSSILIETPKGPLGIKLTL